MPPVDPLHLKGTFLSTADLFETAQKHGVTIDSAAIPPLLDVVKYCAYRPAGTVQIGSLPEAALDHWQDLVLANEGETLAAADIVGWIRRWFPDPVELGIIQPMEAITSATVSGPYPRVEIELEQEKP